MKPRPTPTGLAAIAPAPMSQAEIADLVARARVSTIAARFTKAKRASRKAAARRREPRPITRAELAARLAHDQRITVPHAVALVRKATGRGVSVSGACLAFRRLFPNAPVFARRPGRTLKAWRAEHGWTPASLPRDSKGRRAAIAVLDDGRVAIDAAREFGVTKQAVSQQVAKLREERAACA